VEEKIIRQRNAAGARATRQAKPAADRGDAERTRRRVLSVARSEFAAKGFAGARVDEIAEKAKINKQVIYYHFGNKDDLFKATLELCYEEISQQNAEYAATAPTVPPREAMKDFIGHMFDRVARHSEVIDLIMDENRYKGRHLTNKKLVGASDDPIIAHIQKILDEGIRSGVFVPGTDAAQLFLDVISLCIYYFSHVFTVSAVMDRDLAAPRAVRERRTHIVELVLAAISQQ
jgi:TetR/AcrR family transcriptional regulator